MYKEILADIDDLLETLKPEAPVVQVETITPQFLYLSDYAYANIAKSLYRYLAKWYLPTRQFLMESISQFQDCSGPFDTGPETLSDSNKYVILSLYPDYATITLNGRPFGQYQSYDELKQVIQTMLEPVPNSILQLTAEAYRDILPKVCQDQNVPVQLVHKTVVLLPAITIDATTFQYCANQSSTILTEQEVLDKQAKIIDDRFYA